MFFIYSGRKLRTVNVNIGEKKTFSQPRKSHIVMLTTNDVST